MPKKTSKQVKNITQLEKGIEDFAEEVEKLGGRIEKNCEKKTDWFRRTFGITGPFMSSLIGLLIINFMIWALNYINTKLGSLLLFNISDFLMTNMGLFFLIIIFFSYTSYLSRLHREIYMLFSPFVSAAGVVICIWLFIGATNILGNYFWSSALFRISSFLAGMMYPLFWFILVLGYSILLIQAIAEKEKFSWRVNMKNVKKSGKVRKLYRSGNAKILGGVCGGIAEYLGVDPVLIRLLWVISALAWGSGVLAYIIAWIIIPRNPSHKW